jgi:hypothetical protein
MNHLGLELLASLEQNFAKSKILHLCSIPVIIDDASLASALAALVISAETLRTTSTNRLTKFELLRNIQLKCLHGQHSILAAAEYLPPGDRWWQVDIYREG